MHTVVLLAATALGLDYGWQPLNDGGFEYIIQIEPELLDSLAAGEEIRSDLPPFLRDVRSYKIQVGRGRVPRLGDPQAAVPPVDPPHTPALREPVKQEPPISAPRGGWTPYGEPGQETPARLPRDNLRYPDHRTETPKPKLPVDPRPPRPVDDDTPRLLLPDPSSMALVQTTGYGMGDAKTPESKAEGGPSANKPPVVETASKPWLPLTMALLGLFVSLGGNAYLGLQWWTIRLRCQQLLRDRRLGRGPHAPLSRAEDEVEEQADEEDQDVRAISEEDLPRSKRRRAGA